MKRQEALEYLKKISFAVKAIVICSFASEKTTDKFQFLDGFRGSLANWVIMHHSVYWYLVY